jgi:TRAP transporter TAXI family solute receptor
MWPRQRIITHGSDDRKETDPADDCIQRSRLSISIRQAGFIVSLGVFLLVGLLGASLYYYFSLPSISLRFAVGPSASEDSRLVQALTQHFVRNHVSIRLTPVIEEGAWAAAHAIDTNEADIAIVRRDVAYPQAGQAIAELRENVVAIIVPAPGSRATGPAKAVQNKSVAKAKASKPIEKIEDLEGRRIGVVGHSPANTDVLDVILSQYQLSRDKVTVVLLDPFDIDTSLRGSPVDAIVAIGPVAGSVITDAISASNSGKIQPTFLKIGASEAIAAHHPIYESAEIKAGVLGGGQSPLPEQAVETISFKHYIVGRSDLTEDTVAEFTRLLFAARQALSSEYPVLGKIKKPDTDRDATVPAHPGAAAFLDNNQKTFFEKYSDYLYFGLILLSGLGSGLAWLASYFRADDRVKSLKALDRLVDIVKAAREAETVEELIKLREEADAVLEQTIRQVEANKLDESALMAFSLALDQAQLAISDRQSVLTVVAAPLSFPRIIPARSNYAALKKSAQ